GVIVPHRAVINNPGDGVAGEQDMVVPDIAQAGLKWPPPLGPGLQARRYLLDQRRQHSPGPLRQRVYGARDAYHKLGPPAARDLLTPALEVAHPPDNGPARAARLILLPGIMEPRQGSARMLHTDAARR